MIHIKPEFWKGARALLIRTCVLLKYQGLERIYIDKFSVCRGDGGGVHKD